MNLLYKTLNGELITDTDQKTRRIIAIISSEAIDRDGEIVSAEAMKAAMPGFMKNPVLIAAHTHRLSDGTSPVIGKVLRWWQEKDKTLVEIEFADTPMGLEYYALYVGGYQKAFSIGFSSLKRETRIINGKSVPVHIEIEMYELSAVAVPSQREALIKSMQDQFAKQLATLSTDLKSQISNLKSEMVEQLDQIKDMIIPRGIEQEHPAAPESQPACEPKKSGTVLSEIAKMFTNKN